MLAKIKEKVTIRVIASNRINDPAGAGSILESGQADLVSMARPLLAVQACGTLALVAVVRRLDRCKRVLAEGRFLEFRLEEFVFQTLKFRLHAIITYTVNGIAGHM